MSKTYRHPITEDRKGAREQARAATKADRKARKTACQEQQS